MNKEDGFNLVKNPDFARGLDHWVLDAPPGTVEHGKYAGRTAVRFDRRSHGFIGQTSVESIPAGRYVLEYLAAGEGSGPMNTVSMNVIVTYEDGTYVSTMTSRFAPRTEWGTSDIYGISLERDARAISVGIHFDGPGEGAVAGFVYVTDVSVRRRK